jgi:hypothetical protein
MQVVFFVYWNAVFWGFLLYPDLFRQLAVPESSDPEGSLYMGWMVFTPIFAGFIILELIGLLRKRGKSSKDPGSEAPG